jgi:hypothetical protein
MEVMCRRLCCYGRHPPSQTYDLCDPVYLIDTGADGALQIRESPKDGTAVLDDEFIGFAAEPAIGTLAASRAGATMNFTGRDGAGATENVMRTFITPYRGQLFHTLNFYTADTGATQDTIDGDDLGGVFVLCSAAAGDWGLSGADAATVADEVACRIVAVLDANGIPRNADFAAVTAGTLATQIIFEIANLHTLDQISGG